MNRRNFLKSTTAITGTALMVPVPVRAKEGSSATIPAATALQGAASELPDLTTAQWIWYPSGRTLQNTFILFRKELKLPGSVRRATGWISAESRYRLEVNGARVQWGPPPSDPRWPEADPIDLKGFLREGQNVIGVTVLFYGVGDGTWPIGKPGFLFWLEIEHSDGRIERVASDESWRCALCRAWPPGQYKRWYLRALQEHFDARLYPYGWNEPGFQTDDQWLRAMPLGGSPKRPALSTNYYEYMLDTGSGPADTQLRRRSIPLMEEHFVPVHELAESNWIKWRVRAEDYFDFRVPDAYAAESGKVATQTRPGEWRVELDGNRAAALAFVFKEQVVGWPQFEIVAPEGTIVELLVHEAHRLGGPPLLNTHFESWTRFICREGPNLFETFDFESLRWMQLHIRGVAGVVTIRNLRVRRRVFPWPHKPVARSEEPGLQRLFDATINTLHNCAQETLVDGMARERQQYSGDGGHQLHAVHLAFGEGRLVKRYLQTFSQGMTKEGFFLDCWPAYDRLARLVERQFDLSGWGPILDHGVGFNFDCWSHYMYTGDLDALREPYPRLVRFARYLQGLAAGGLLPVEDLGIPSVWIDHAAYQRQRHKQCAFNLYAAAAMQRALAPMCRAFGDSRQAEAVAAFGRQLQETATAKFWSPDRGVFINNLPWLEDEKNVRLCDRSLATAVLFDQCPADATAAAVRTLVDCPSQMGFSYPANACWRLWALAKAGRADVIVSDLRRRWATMISVRENNTLQEDWAAQHDSGAQWSHCAVAPLFVAYHGLMGLWPLEPGFQRFQLRPQLADLGTLELTAFTVRGPISLTSSGDAGDREVTLGLPETGRGDILLPESEKVDLPRVERTTPKGLVRYELPQGGTVKLKLSKV